MAAGALYDALNRHRAALLQHEAWAAQEMTDVWQNARKNIQTELNFLNRQIEAVQSAGGEVNQSWLYRQERYKALIAQTNHQIDRFSQDAQQIVEQSQAYAVQAGLRDSSSLLDASVPEGVSWGWNRLPVSTVESFVGFAGDGSPLRTLFDGFGAEASQSVRMRLSSAIAMGWNPRRISSDVANDLGVSLSRALTISRTETLRAYRAASLANYQANSDVVGEWIWSADLSARSCGMCIAMNGTRHSLDETLDSHPNCRCAAVPVTKSWSDILGPLGIDTSGIPDMSAGPDVESGADWFDNQSAATQRAILGPGKYAAYRAGDLDLSDLVGVQHDRDWSTSRYEKSLRQLGLSRYAGGKGAA